jgi:hypothetical protein
MAKSKISQLTQTKTANMIFVCHINRLEERAAELNKLFQAGWVIEKSEVVGDVYFVHLQTCSDARKVFYVAVGEMSPWEVSDYIDNVKKCAKDSDGDFFIPVRG